jgi:hypothetical protein
MKLEFAWGAPPVQNFQHLKTHATLTYKQPSFCQTVPTSFINPRINPYHTKSATTPAHFHKTHRYPTKKVLALLPQVCILPGHSTESLSAGEAEF